MTNQNSNTEISVYRELQQLLHTLPIGFPETKSGADIRILKHLFSPEEAKIAIYMKFSWDNLELVEVINERAKDLGYTVEELKERLDKMVSKGAITGYKKGGTKIYSLAMFMVGMFEWQVNKITKEFADDMHQFMKGGFAMEAASTQITPLRTIPVEASLTHELNVASYEELESIIETAEGPFALFNCVCKQLFDVIERPCKATNRREVCMSWGDMAKFYIDEGWGRQITKEEVKDVLKKNQEEGLILQPGNSQKPIFICSCCSCCCETLTGIKKLPNPADYVTTNHYAEVDSDLCAGCESCFDICQMTAITIEDNISSVNRKRCIGCGNCVAVCTSGAMALKKKDKLWVPPETEVDLYNKIGERKKVLIEREKKRQLRKEKRFNNLN
ncbi:MAG TPA: 4Fe-4S dicluster domain-containing protein [archaeon]|nr:4Fe-4S dicluster domain-containing protein [archaeon]